MSVVKSFPKDPVARVPSTQAQTAAPRPRRSFLSDIRIDYGPADLFGPLFLKADDELRERGVTLSFEPLEALVEVNRQNKDSWLPLFPLFDPALSGIGPDRSFALLGRNASGKVVTCQAVCLMLLTQRTMKQQLEGLNFFYHDPVRQRAPGEAIIVTAPSAETLVGRAAFSGAVWYHPDYRKRGMVDIFGRAVRACAYTRWNPDIVFSFMGEANVASKVAARAGYRNVEWDITLVNSPVVRGGSLRLALIWSTAAEELEFYRSYLAGGDAQIDRVVQDRPANQKLAL